MVIPVGVHPDSGTPVAVQLVARPGREKMLIGLAASIEAELAASVVSASDERLESRSSVVAES